MKLFYEQTINPRKACVVARYLNSPVDYVHIDLSKGENRTPEYLAINPNGKVPALEDGDLTRDQRLEPQIRELGQDEAHGKRVAVDTEIRRAESASGLTPDSTQAALTAPFSVRRLGVAQNAQLAIGAATSPSGLATKTRYVTGAPGGASGGSP